MQPDYSQTYKLRVVTSYLIIALIYLGVFTAVFISTHANKWLISIHIIDLFVCAIVATYLSKTRDVIWPSRLLCFFAYLTILTLAITGGYRGTGLFIAFPYAIFVMFLSSNRVIGYFWQYAMLLGIIIVWILGLSRTLTLPLNNSVYGLFIFGYLLTILLLTAYAKEKQFADAEISRKTSELSLKNKQLNQLNTAKDDFILLSSHQLRTPATGVKQYLSLLKEGYYGKLSQEHLQLIQRAYDSNERQINIINDLLLVAQLDTGKLILDKVPINVSQLIKNVIDERSSHFISRDQNIIFKQPKQPAIVKADPVQMRIVVENLIDNASKYTPQGKQVTVEVKRLQANIKILVRDEGIGIDKKDFSKLFRKFSRLTSPLSSAVEGTGLGLYWAKKVINMHRGKLSVRSKQNQGSTFEIIMPRIK